jgi:DNA-binding LytR/AlgR family response regulator
LSQGISELSQKLPVQKFSRIHRSYLVAWEKIKQLTNKWILIGNEKIPLTRRGRKLLLQLVSL